MDRPILILGALRREIAGIRRGMSVDAQFKAGRADVWTGTFEHAPVALVRTGIGRTQAGRALEQALHRITPSLILSVGYAGALDPSLKVGDLVLADRVLEQTPSNPPFGYTLGADWLARVREAALPAGIPLHQGALVTVDAPAAGPQAKSDLARRHGALAVDMETSALIHQANEKAIPFLSVRAISDTAEQSLIDVSSLVGEDGEVSTLKAGWYAATHPQTIPHFVSLCTQSQQATQNLTTFLQAFLRTRPGQR